MGAILAVVLIVQLRAKRYVPWIYWLTVVLLSIVDTLILDNLVDNMGVTLLMSSTIFAAALIAVFAGWWFSERTLSVQTIVTTKRELFYWAAILFTFSLGTLAGDLISESAKLGYPLATALFAAVVVLIYAAYRWLKLGPILAFWLD